MRRNIKIAISVFTIFVLISITSSDAEIRVGIAGPLSGSALNTGEQQEIGANSAIADLNKNGGVIGQQIIAYSVDDACDPEQAKAAAKKLIAEEVSVVIGHVCSAASIAAAGIYEEAGIIMITPSSTNPRVTEDGHGNVFRVIGRDDQQGIIAGNFIADNFTDKRVAIIHDGQAYGLGLAEYTKSQMNKRGVAEVLFEKYAPDQPDYKDIVDKIVGANAEVIYGGGYQGDLGIIIRQVKKERPDVQLVGGDSLTSRDFLFIAGNAAQGSFLTFGPEIRSRPEAAEVVARIREEDAYEPEGYTLYSYAAVQVWAQAVNSAGSLDTAAVAEKLRSESFDTVLGTIGFDDKGDVTGISSFVWYVWTDEDYILAE